MNADGALLAIRVTGAAHPAAAVKAIRAATGLSLARVRSAMDNGLPIAIARLHRPDHDQEELRATEVFDMLRREEIQFDILLNSRVESPERYRNLMAQWRETCVETAMLADLDSGTPRIETLQWLKSTGDEEAFRQTLLQILSGDGYTVGQETLDWVKRQSQDMSQSLSQELSQDT